jgi:phosphatidate cytidylyltransferase
MFAPLVLKIVLWGLAAALWLLALYWVRHYPRLTIWHRTLPLLGIGALLLCATTSALYGLWELNQWWLLYVFILVWTADSGAYFVGRAYGKTKLAVQVSPGKTIEGFAGGLLLCMAVVVVLHFTLHPYNEVSMPKLLLMSLLTVLASVLGDLFESMLKRQAGIKDSGTLLPGHGGVLDRIDSLLAAAPIFALCVFTIGLL